MDHTNEEKIKKLKDSLKSSTYQVFNNKDFEFIEKCLYDIVKDIFEEKDKKKFANVKSQELSINKYSLEYISDIIQCLNTILNSDQNRKELIRPLSIFLLHFDRKIRLQGLNVLQDLIEEHNIEIPAEVFEIALSSLLVDIKQQTTEEFVQFLASNRFTRLIDYLVENLYYEVLLKKEILRSEKKIIKKGILNNQGLNLEEWELESRLKLMFGEKVTSLVASADCGEYQDALVEGKGIISFEACVKGLCEFGSDLYLPSLNGLMNRISDSYHLKWLKVLAIIQGNKEYFKDIQDLATSSDDSNFKNYVINNKELSEYLN